VNIIFAIPGFQTDSKSVQGRAVRKVVDTVGKRVGKASFRPGVVVFRIDRAFHTRSSKQENAAALEVLLAGLCALNRIWLQCYPNTPPLSATPVYYERTVVWDTIPALLSRGFGDCKSLTACEVAEFREQGFWCRPVFRFQGDPSAIMFHILIMLEDGTWKDPSAERGMHSYQETANGGSIPGNIHGY
jgi:hypothetical protein